MAQPRKLESELRRMLDLLVRSQEYTNEEREKIGDRILAEVRDLPREEVLDALDRAIGSSKKRRQEAVYLLGEWADSPEVQERIGAWLADPDPNMRSWLIQIVGSSGLKQFAGQLNTIMESDPDQFCRDMAMHAASQLKAPENLPTILRLAEKNNQSVFRLAWALKEFATDQCQPFLARWFSDKSIDTQHRIVAAWGLAKLGDENAVGFLASHLKEFAGPNPPRFASGFEMRAAQALADVFGWEFEWGSSNVAPIALKAKEANLIKG